jgi:hypothetical protein
MGARHPVPPDQWPHRQRFIAGTGDSQVTGERQGQGYAFLATSFQAVDPVRICRPRRTDGTVRRSPLAKSLGQLADLGFWVAAVAAEGLQEGSLPSLAQRDTVLGETWRMSATSAVWR